MQRLEALQKRKVFCFFVFLVSICTSFYCLYSLEVRGASHANAVERLVTLGVGVDTEVAERGRGRGRNDLVDERERRGVLRGHFFNHDRNDVPVHGVVEVVVRDRVLARAHEELSDVVGVVLEALEGHLDGFVNTVARLLGCVIKENLEIQLGNRLGGAAASGVLHPYL